jgi:N-acetylmuramoyl-L-alanine amidase CwlA
VQFNVNLPELKSSTALKLKNDLIDFVRIQGQQCRDNERLLGSSEIIESTFGKQKNLEQQYSKEGFTSLILGIGASIGTLTIDTVKQALHSTPVKKVTAWYKDILGETEQSKKRKVFSEVKNWKQSGLNL